MQIRERMIMVDMKVLGLTMDGESNSPILVLQEKGGAEILPIWIGASEALSISLALNGKTLDRPITHETMFRALSSVGVKLEGVYITELRDGTYFAEMEMLSGTERIRLDCRPSDGIALAVRAHAPIRVAEDILETTAKSRTRRRGEDKVTTFMPDDPASPEAAYLLQSMEAASPYKM